MARFTSVDIDDATFDDIGIAVEYWQGLKGESVGPDRSKVDLLQLPSDLIPRICIVDVEAEPVDFIYRFWGTGITRMHKYDLTHKSVLDLTPPEYGQSLWEQYAEVVQRRDARCFLTEVPLGVGYKTYYSAVRLPLSSDGVTVDGVLSAEEYGSNEKKLRDRFEALWELTLEGEGRGK